LQGKVSRPLTRHSAASTWQIANQGRLGKKREKAIGPKV